jgi:hypothetical protein
MNRANTSPPHVQRTFPYRVELQMLVVLIVLFSVGVLCLSPTRLYATDHRSVEGTIKAWRDRESRTRSLDYRCEGQCAQSKRFALGRARIKLKPDELQGTISFPTTLRFVLDANGRSRLETTGSRFATGTRTLVPNDAIEVTTDGQRKTQFSPGNAPFTNLHIQPDKRDRALDARVLPLMIVLRPFDKEMGIFEPGALSLSDAPTRGLSGTEVLLKHPYGTITVDTAREHVPTRYTEVISGRVALEIVVEYSRDRDHGWLPASWNSISLFSDGSVRESVALKVKHYRLNEEPGDELFEIESPPGTWVNNYTTEESYILREGGEKRPVLPGEFDGKNYETLLKTDPPTTKTSGGWAIPVVVLVGLALVVALLVWRWRRGRATSPA